MINASSLLDTVSDSKPMGSEISLERQHGSERDSISDFLREQENKGTLRRSKRKASADDGSDSDYESDADVADQKPVQHYYVFDEWLETSADKTNSIDILSEEARLPILFFMLIKILIQGMLCLLP